MPDTPKADITDYFEEGHTVEEFENLIRNVDDTEKICVDVQQDQKQDTGKKRSVIQKSKDEVAGCPALVFKFLDCNYDEDGNVKSVKHWYIILKSLWIKTAVSPGKSVLMSLHSNLIYMVMCHGRMRIIAEHGAAMMIQLCFR